LAPAHCGTSPQWHTGVVHGGAMCDSVD
jgi:hypothetical protein